MKYTKEQTRMSSAKASLPHEAYSLMVVLRALPQVSLPCLRPARPFMLES